MHLPRIKKRYFAIAFLFLFFALFIKPIKAASQPKKLVYHQPACPGSQGKGKFRCLAHVVTDKNGHPLSATSPTGYTPQQFKTAYNLNGIAPTNQIVAVVVAYDQPNILSDLNTYSSQFGLPQIAACPVSSGTATSPCFQKVNEFGRPFYPSVDSGWALEASLDVETIHAICNNCNVLLVEAYSANFLDLLTAVDTARKMGAAIISNSYGSSGEFSFETSYDSHFNHPGIVFTFSAGDSGFGTSYPAASPFVTAVGGTTLNLNPDDSYNSEEVWNLTGSGCSIFEPKPSFQKDTGCGSRTIADLSADADPATGASIYDSLSYFGQTGWFQVGGTSLSAPIIAAVYALAGGVGPTIQGNSVPYSKVNYALNFHDITIGDNGICFPSYLCAATLGYDGPSGLGTPEGTGALGGIISPSPTATITPTPTLTTAPSPTATPTPIPTATPIQTPTPTITPLPTPLPTDTPAILPTFTPTIVPSATPTLAPDHFPPTINITFPSSGSSVTHSTAVTITANASDDVAVTKLNFYANGQLICSELVSFLSSLTAGCQWNVPPSIGSFYLIDAIAFDAAGFSNVSNFVTVTAR